GSSLYDDRGFPRFRVCAGNWWQPEESGVYAGGKQSSLASILGSVPESIGVPHCIIRGCGRKWRNLDEDCRLVGRGHNKRRPQPRRIAVAKAIGGMPLLQLM